MKTRTRFDKFDLYTRAVQDPPAMCDFLYNVYRDIVRREPSALGEDFCGSFALSREWVSRNEKASAIAVDKAALPLTYGKRCLLREKAGTTCKRLRVLRRDVLKMGLPKSDILCALNFSYGVFKKRAELVTYLRHSLRRLSRKGILVLDCLGGMELGNGETRTDHPEFSYFWDQVKFDPISREAKFHIHFQRPNEKKRLRVFTYDWRMWSVPELRDAFSDAGFRRTHVYWEGAGRLADGNSANCFRSWVAYVVGEA